MAKSNAGRKAKRNVTYFPVYCHPSKTLEILESKYGKDGFVFFYKLFRILGNEEGHYYDCRNKSEFEFLAGKLNLASSKVEEILDYLCDLGKIDSELWENRVIWYQGFVDTLQYAYHDRTNDLPTRDDCIEDADLNIPTGNTDNQSGNSDNPTGNQAEIELPDEKPTKNPGTKLNKTKRNKNNNDKSAPVSPKIKSVDDLSSESLSSFLKTFQEKVEHLTDKESFLYENEEFLNITALLYTRSQFITARKRGKELDETKYLLSVMRGLSGDANWDMDSTLKIAGETAISLMGQQERNKELQYYQNIDTVDDGENTRLSREAIVKFKKLSVKEQNKIREEAIVKVESYGNSHGSNGFKEKLVMSEIVQIIARTEQRKEI